VDFVTRKYGPLPGWAWGALAGAAALAFWYFRRGGQQSTGMSAVSPAAGVAQSAVPFVPSVSVTGISPGASAASNAPPPASPNATRGIITGGTTGVFQSANSYPNGLIAILPRGTPVTLAGPPVQGVMGGSWGTPPSNFWQPIQYGGLTAYVHSQLVDISGGGGQGGWGYAGSPAAAGALGGWTVGWFPASAGPGYALAGAGGTSSGPAGRRGVAGSRLLPLRQGFGGGAGSTRTRVPRRQLRRRDLSTARR